jgi:UDP-glucose 4-epimerase
MLAGLRQGKGGPTPPLEAQAGGRLRQKEVATGVGANTAGPKSPVSHG